jgi:hypothetical protein
MKLPGPVEFALLIFVAGYAVYALGMIVVETLRIRRITRRGRGGARPR